MDAKRWLAEGRLSKTTGIIIAPEDFAIEGKSFFTFDERFSFARYFPEGWRPMTAVEAWMVIEEFITRSGDPNEKFLKKLGFNMVGYVFPEMEKYNEDPSADNVQQELIQEVAMEARFWVDGPSSDKFAPALCIKRLKRPKIENFARSVGARIRLVYPTKGF